MEETIYKQYVASKFTDEELATIFPEMPEIIEEKIVEYKTDRADLIQRMSLFAQRVEKIAVQEKKDDFFVWFWGYAYLRYFCAPQIVQIDKHLYRLRRQRRLFIKDKDKKYDIEWDEAKERAKNQSLHDIALPYLEQARQIGNRITALCPFHKEKNPSFVIFLNQNSYHCFGCQANGDILSFYMRVNNVSFRDAVKELAV